MLSDNLCGSDSLRSARALLLRMVAEVEVEVGSIFLAFETEVALLERRRPSHEGRHRLSLHLGASRVFSSIERIQTHTFIPSS